MVSTITLRRYIEQCDEIIALENIDAAKEMQTEILAVFGTDIKGLKSGLTNYSFVGAISSFDGKITCVGDKVDFIKDLKILRSHLQAELEKIEPPIAEEDMRTEIFISHRSTDAPVAEMIKDFLVATGIPNDRIFCSSLPANDVNEQISREVKKHLKNTIINILILSRDYYESPYCLNEAGVAWYLDEVLAIPIGLPEIDPKGMIGFLNGDYKLRRLDNDGDISYLYDQAQGRLNTSTEKHSVITQETQKLKEKYKKHIESREDSIPSDSVEIETSWDGGGGSSDPFDYPPIQLHASVMLFFAAEDGGEILVKTTLSGTSFNAGKVCLNKSNEPREIAKWDAAVNQLLMSGYIKKTGRKDSLFQVTEKGYNISDSFKLDNELDSSMTPDQIFAMFDEGAIQ